MEACEATRDAGAVCARFPIRVRRFKMVGRYKRSGPKGLKDTSRKPTSSHLATLSAAAVNDVLSLEKRVAN